MIRYPELGKRAKPGTEDLFGSVQHDIADLGPTRDVLGTAGTCEGKALDKQIPVQTTAPTAATYDDMTRDPCALVPGTKVSTLHTNHNLTFGWQRKRDWKALLGKTDNRGQRKYCDYPSWLKPARSQPQPATGPVANESTASA